MPANPVSPVRVLYAEDNAFDIDLAKTFLDENAPELSVDVVRTGEECVARLRSAGYDVLLLDNHLPDMDGEQVLKRLAAESIAVPVVMTTSTGDETLAVRALQLGVCDYVPKDGDYVAKLPVVLKSAITEYHAHRGGPFGPAVNRRRILYVEQNRADIDLTINHLAEVAPHLTVDVVRSAGAALQCVEQAVPDLVLADLRMSDMGALDLLREAKHRGMRVPFIVITGRGDENAAVAALKLGASDYIVKRDDYLTRLPYAIDNAIARFQLVELNEHLQRELIERARLQQTAAESLALLDSLQKHAPIGIAFMDRECRYQRINDAMAAINGLPVQAHLGRSIAEVLPHFYDQIEPMYALALSGELVQNVDITTENPTHPGEHRQFVASFYPVYGRGQDVVGVGMLVSEVTEQKRAEASLHQHARALTEAARQKDEFLAMLSHELRNPLAPIRTALGLLRRAASRDEITAMAQDVIQRQVTHMARLLDDLLDMARITSGRINLNVQTVDLRRVVAESVESVRNVVTARRHRLETFLTPGPLTVKGDSTRLVQVLVNLLNNAAKYTNEGGVITVTVSTEASQAVLRVSDTGMGIPERLLPKIFDLFTQDERSLDRAQGGLGIGLTLVRRIVEMHHGTVEARSDGRGRGSEFTVRLPLHVTEDVAANRESPNARGPSKPARCLIVEDNVDAARMLELALALEGHEVRLAFDGRDAIEAAAEFQPDAVILDVGLPRMNGYDAARAIRRLPGLEDVHIIALTGYGQAADREKSREAGVDEHLVKPIEIDVLLRALAAHRAPPAS